MSLSSPNGTVSDQGCGKGQSCLSFFMSWWRCNKEDDFFWPLRAVEPHPFSFSFIPHWGQAAKKAHPLLLSVPQAVQSISAPSSGNPVQLHLLITIETKASLPWSHWAIFSPAWKPALLSPEGNIQAFAYSAGAASSMQTPEPTLRDGSIHLCRVTTAER